MLDDVCFPDVPLPLLGFARVRASAPQLIFSPRPHPMHPWSQSRLGFISGGSDRTVGLPQHA